MPKAKTRLEGGLRIKELVHRKSEPGRPLVSIITIVRNGKYYIEDTIKSVINQTYDNVEYIIIDGGSTDGTVDIIKRYEDAIDYWMSEKDEGIYDAMNKGIELSNGEWINFMNAGDKFYEKQTIQNVFSGYSDHVDFIYGHHQIIYEDNFSRIQKAGDVKNLWKGMVFCHQSLFAKTLLMKQYKFNTQDRIGSDFEFIYTCFIKNYIFFNSDVTISSIMAGGVSDTSRIASIISHWNTLKKNSPAFKTDILYSYLIVDSFFRKQIKRFVPHILLMFFIKNK